MAHCHPGILDLIEATEPFPRYVLRYQHFSFQLSNKHFELQNGIENSPSAT